MRSKSNPLSSLGVAHLHADAPVPYRLLARLGGCRVRRPSSSDTAPTEDLEAWILRRRRRCPRDSCRCTESYRRGGSRRGVWCQVEPAARRIIRSVQCSAFAWHLLRLLFVLVHVLGPVLRAPPRSRWDDHVPKPPDKRRDVGLRQLLKRHLQRSPAPNADPEFERGDGLGMDDRSMEHDVAG